MKVSTKTILGVLISIAWLIAYAGTGAFLLARDAAANLNHVQAFVPVVVFLWIGGYFVGHAIIGKVFLFILRPKSISLATINFNAAQLEVLDIDNLPAVSKPAAEKYSRGHSYLTRKQNNNDKKDTAKIAKISVVTKAPAKIYNLPQYCS